MVLTILEITYVIFSALGCGFTVWGVINWLSGDKTSRHGLHSERQIIIGLALMLCTTNAYHLLYPICNTTSREDVLEQIKVYSESGTLISQYDYVTDVHHTSNGDTSFIADDGSSVIISGGIIVREVR